MVLLLLRAERKKRRVDEAGWDVSGLESDLERVVEYLVLLHLCHVFLNRDCNLDGCGVAVLLRLCRIKSQVKNAMMKMPAMTATA